MEILKFKDQFKSNTKVKKKGFSLVELVVVMAIIGILMVVMAPNYKGFVKSAKNTAVQADAKSLMTMIDLYEVKNEAISKDITIKELVNGKLVTSVEAETIIKYVGQFKEDNPILNVKVGDLEGISKGGEIASSGTNP